VRTSGSAFSWIVNDAEVWRQNTLTTPVRMPLSRTKAVTASVTSVNPCPGVATVTIALAWRVASPA
jgi:hypothetical protein